MHDEWYLDQALIRQGDRWLSVDSGAARRDQDAAHDRSRSIFWHLDTQQQYVLHATYLHAATKDPSSALCLLWGRETTWLSRCGPDADPLLRICTGRPVQASHGGYYTTLHLLASISRTHVLLPRKSNTPDLSPL
jgi:hypothetical protein